MNIIVQKYGGTSVATAEKIKRVAHRVLKVKQSGYGVVVVVSAMGHSTDFLIDMANQITKSPPRRELDMLLATGEQVSISLLSMAIQSLGAKAISMTGLQSGIITDRNYTEAKITEIKTPRLLKHLNEGKSVIVAGFQGVSLGTEITTLGRGGSDTTAAAIAAALRAERCEIYTDVDGIYTADPNLVPDATKLNFISYQEMVELAGYGAQVLHPRSVEIAMKYKLPMQVRPSYSEAKGTEILEEKKLEKVVITGVTSNENVAKIAIQKVPDQPGVAAKIFGDLAKQGVPVRLIIQSIGQENVKNVTLVVDRKFLTTAIETLGKLRDRLGAKGIIHEAPVGEVSIVGSGIASTPGVPARMFKALAKKKINIDLISTSAFRITCVIDHRRTGEAVKAIHEEFNLSGFRRRKIKSG